MNLLHPTPDAPRDPERPSPGQEVTLWIGTWPIETDQRVHVACNQLGRDGRQEAHEVEASWRYNEGPNSYWCARLGPFADGDVVEHWRDRVQSNPDGMLRSNPESSLPDPLPQFAHHSTWHWFRFFHYRSPNRGAKGDGVEQV
jgi:hypothetical protein